MTTPTYRHLIVRAYRASGLTLRALEERSGVPRSSLHRYLREPPETDLTAQSLELLAKALEVDLPAK